MSSTSVTGNSRPPPPHAFSCPSLVQTTPATHCPYPHHRYLHPSSPPLDLDAQFWELRDSLAQCELLLLRCLCFRVSFQHPHKVQPSAWTGIMGRGMGRSQSGERRSQWLIGEEEVRDGG